MWLWTCSQFRRVIDDGLERKFDRSFMGGLLMVLILSDSFPIPVVPAVLFLAMVLFLVGPIRTAHKELLKKNATTSPLELFFSTSTGKIYLLLMMAFLLGTISATIAEASYTIDNQGQKFSCSRSFRSNVTVYTNHPWMICATDVRDRHPEYDCIDACRKTKNPVISCEAQCRDYALPGIELAQESFMQFCKEKGKDAYIYDTGYSEPCGFEIRRGVCVSNCIRKEKGQCIVTHHPAWPTDDSWFSQYRRVPFEYLNDNIYYKDENYTQKVCELMRRKNEKYYR